MRSRPDAGAARCTAFRSRSRTSSTSPACRRPPRRSCARVSWPTPTPRPWSPARCRRRLRGQDEPARVRVRHDVRGLRLGAGAASDRRRPLARRIQRRLGGLRGHGDGARKPGDRHGRFDSHPRRSVRHRRTEAHAWGEIAAEGVVPLSRQLDHVGPLAQTAADAALLYELWAIGPPR